MINLKVLDMTDDAIKAALREATPGSPNIPFALEELDRRSAERHATTAELLGKQSLDATKALVRTTAVLSAATELLAFATVLLGGFAVASWNGDDVIRAEIVALFAFGGVLAVAVVQRAGKTPS